MNNNSKCPRCGNGFICNPDPNESCDCSSIILGEKETEFLKSTYNSCLCIKCLEEILLENKSDLKPENTNKFD